MRAEQQLRIRQRMSSKTPGKHFELRVLYPNRTFAVREALATTMQALEGYGLSPCDSVNVELVLAEALNNIAEHAYKDDTRGMVELQIAHRDNSLVCVIIDDGAPMPNATLPACTLPEDDMPEGGFGWFVIQSLSQSVQYQRVNDRNHLVIEMALDRSMTSS